MTKIKLAATTTFGLEAVVKREVQNLGFENISASDGCVNFTGDFETLIKANLNLRSADRVMWVLAEFKAETFEELFQGVKKINWGDIFPKDAHFIVTGKSIKSTLSSVPACQSVAEKAVIEKLKEKYKVERFEKSGAVYKIQIALLKDMVTVSMDTSGAGLHKRGYRENQVAAPLKETLAAALIDLSYYKKDRILLDPTCGSGTIAIEAAMRSRNIAPGLMRKFAAEQWEIIDSKLWKTARAEAYSKIDVDFMPTIYASDIDPRAIETAKHNASLAGVDDCIYFDNKPLNEVRLPGEYGVCICNPPYAERMGELDEVEQLYRDMGKLFRADKTWSVYVITSHEGFEKLYGARADKKRKLFNGNVKTDYYQFYGARPPKK